MAEELVTISGTVENIVFYNEDNGYTVLDMEVEGEPITVVGNLSVVSEGDVLRVMGHYTSHQAFGPQFKAVSHEVSLPEGTAAIERYLSSGAIKGIRTRLAKRIVETFGEKTLEIIEKKPARLAEVPGISKAKAEEISAEFQKAFGMRTVMLFLARYDIPMSYSVRLWKEYGPLSVDLVKENPFVLCIPQIGASFKEADQIRAEMEMQPYAAVRLKAGILSVLRISESDGNTCAAGNWVLAEAGKLLNVDKELLKEPLLELVENEAVIKVHYGEEASFYLPAAYYAEWGVAERLSLMARSLPSLISEERTRKKTERKIDALEKELGITYAMLQKEAIATALLSPMMILTGGPGTGKTTTLNAIIQLAEAEGDRILLAAPTGRAAKRLSDLTGKPAQTIHRLLGVSFGEEEQQMFIHNEKKLLRCDMVVVDELSMVDIFLFDSLLKALPMTSKILLVGDSDQLPSVGMGNVLSDLIGSKKIPTVTLTEIFRQASQSLIVTNSHAIIQGKMPAMTVKDNDFFLVPRATLPSIAKTVVDVVARRLPEAYAYSPLWDVQVLCPLKKSAIGTIALNGALQEKLNPPSPDKLETKVGETLFRMGDKVMQIRNNYDIQWTREGKTSSEEPTGTGIFNGDVGIITMIDPAAKTLKVMFENRVASYTFEQLRELDLAYAMTVHKSQGSEFSAVVLPLSPNGGRMYYRNLLYTAVTRAKELLIVIGTEDAVRRMVIQEDSRKKRTHLKEFMQDQSGERG